ncbi:hypothetical protein MPUL_53570 [Mycolicibacterium pulveris]|uniref:Bro-N domain-containing protein n=1 Tax=Mycolicibacterium pulveris TaxID=36813 RepID=A0A7I7UU87_MYCPV|nr:BRO family protein [Mycolicibacterium pulveris]BBY84199.1 hypothetical protein MPUL_53570 [Mycolicibacterium pulveris]
MTAELVPFTYGDAPIRVVMVNGEPWFAAPDVAKALGYRDAWNLVRRLDEDEATHSVSTPGGPQNITIISESGLYVAVLGSQVPGARDFKRWVTRVVLPQIRKTGSYAAELDLSDPIAAIEAAHARTGQAIEVAKAERARAERAEAEAKALTAAIERDAPLVAKAEAHTVSDSAVHRQEFAREVQTWGRKQGLEIKQAAVFRFLGHIGLFIRGDRTDTAHATSDAIKRGLAFTDKGTARNGHAWATGKLTAAGQDYAWRRITRHVAEHGSLELPRELRGSA